MSQRHATTTTTTKNLNAKTKVGLQSNSSVPKLRNVAQTPKIASPVPQPKSSEVVLYKAKKAKKERKREKKWWEHAGPLIDTLGSKLFDNIIPLIAGFGDYDIESNSIMAAGSNGKIGSTVPIMSNTKHCNIVRHREYIQDVLSSTDDFNPTVLAIQPGLSSSFPWLASVAGCFTNYRMRGLVYEFVSTASNVSTTPALGYVAMATQYNSLDLSFTNKRALENSEYACSAAPTVSFLHPVECDPSMVPIKEPYIRQGSLQGGDIRLYDMGRFNIATGGQSAAGLVIGELWCTYEVELYYPMLPNQNGDFLTDTFMSNKLTTAAAQIFPPDLSNGSSPSNFFPIFGSVTANTGDIVFPSNVVGNNYRVTLSWNHPLGNLALLPVATSVNVNDATVFNSVSGPNSVGTFSANSNGYDLLSFVVLITGTSPVIRITCANPSMIGVAGSTVVARISQIPTGFAS